MKLADFEKRHPCPYVEYMGPGQGCQIDLCRRFQLDNLCTCRDPRQKRLQKAEDEKAEKTKRDGAKLSFQEKMKLFAVEAGEKTPNRDKAKISSAQRDLEDDGSGNEEFEDDYRAQNQ